jgi:hypothetical protein
MHGAILPGFDFTGTGQNPFPGLTSFLRFLKKMMKIIGPGDTVDNSFTYLYFFNFLSTSQCRPAGREHIFPTTRERRRPGAVNTMPSAEGS